MGKEVGFDPPKLISYPCRPCLRSAPRSSGCLACGLLLGKWPVGTVPCRPTYSPLALQLEWPPVVDMHKCCRSMESPPRIVLAARYVCRLLAKSFGMLWPSRCVWWLVVFASFSPFLVTYISLPDISWIPFVVVVPFLAINGQCYRSFFWPMRAGRKGVVDGLFGSSCSSSILASPVLRACTVLWKRNAT